ncbi:MAG: tyrosine-type recombinase/integrase [Phycisphaerae bacterium]|nr:tyrosine-type recombinase/integrase [Phycisphaerae bacterium]
MPASAAAAFMQAGRDRATHHTLSEVPLDTDEIVRLIAVADAYQLALFSFHIFHGVRVAEPCWLMHEFVDIEKGWIDYRCIEELAYRTKGRIDKRLPIPSAMRDALQPWMMHGRGGLVLLKRRHFRAAGMPSRRVTSLQAIIQQVHGATPKGWSQRSRAAVDLLKKHGAVEGDDVRREFNKLLAAAGIYRKVTPKALRHHFATALERAGVPYYTRKYLLGHRLNERGGHGSDITAIYTHLEPDFVRATYQRVLDGPLAKVVDAFEKRLAQLTATTTAAHAAPS